MNKIKFDGKVLKVPREYTVHSIGYMTWGEVDSYLCEDADVLGYVGQVCLLDDEGEEDETIFITDFKVYSKLLKAFVEANKQGVK